MSIIFIFQNVLHSSVGGYLTVEAAAITVDAAAAAEAVSAAAVGFIDVDLSLPQPQMSVFLLHLLNDEFPKE